MNDQRAAELAGRLVASTPGWGTASAAALIDEITTWRDIECGEAAVESISRTWTGTSRPALGVIVAAYNRAMDAKRQRGEDSRPRGMDVYVDPVEGEPVAERNYRQALNRGRADEIVADSATAIRVIRNSERVVRGVHISHYSTVLTAFRGDHRKTKASLDAVPKLQWLNNGTLRLPGDG